jgi:hypothetical protein
MVGLRGFGLRLRKLGAGEARRQRGCWHSISSFEGDVPGLDKSLYVAEFRFRYNNRFNDDIFGTAIEGC